MYILEGLEKLLEENFIRFHTPGHKGEDFFSATFKKSVQDIDFTEIPGSDNLHHAQEMILQSEKRAAEVFKAKKSYFLINGTTVGIQASVLSVCNPGDKILIPRNCHRSVWSALILGNIIPVYLSPQTHPETGIALSISPEEVAKKIKDHPDIKAAIITYPSYYGTCSDIESIGKILHNENKILLVDEAHGAHLAFHDQLPITALEAGADIAVQSTHKLLSSLTQSSMLHVGSDAVSIEKLELFLSLLQSSSPSYPLMASLDFATQQVKEEGYKRWDDIIQWNETAYNKINHKTSMLVLGRNLIGHYGVVNFDTSKILIDVSPIGLRGVEVDQILRRKYGIQVELSDFHYILAMTGMGSQEKHLKRLTEAILDINNLYNTHKKPAKIQIATPLEKLVLSPRDAVSSETQEVAFENAIGKISKEFIIPYPPGIPIVLPGEEITKEISQYIKDIKGWGGEIIGTHDPQLKTIKVVKM